MQQRWPYERNEARALGMLDGRFTDQSNSHSQATVPVRNAWHRDDDFSGFAEARKQVGYKQRHVRVAHLDTVDPGHASLPAGLNLGRQFNTIPEEAGQNAVDRASRTGTANRGTVWAPWASLPEVQ